VSNTAVAQAPTSQDMRDAATALHGLVVRTPVLDSARLRNDLRLDVVAKAESLQYTGSFKLRGALNRIRTLTQAQREAGLVTVSAGNAALGAAYAGKLFDTKVTVVMPANAVPEKLEAVRSYGGDVVTDGITSSTIAFERARRLERDDGLTFIHPYDDPMVIAGAATATLELLDDAPGVRQLFVPCSGGGLLAGAITAVNATGRHVEVIGVQPSGNDSFVRSLAAGRPIGAEKIATVADGLTAPQPGDLPFAIVQAAGARILVVDDDAILAAMAMLVRYFRLVIEPSAAAAFAGLLQARASTPSDQIDGMQAILVSGSNVNAELFSRIVSQGM
jgi:threonine dehydratase